MDVGGLGEPNWIDVPGIVFMRGGSVGILVILECDGQEYTILTRQARVPAGLSLLPEIPAGMLDGSGNFKGVAATEIEQECHMKIQVDDLVDLTEFAYGKTYRGICARQCRLRYMREFGVWQTTETPWALPSGVAPLSPFCWGVRRIHSTLPIPPLGQAGSLNRARRQVDGGA